MLITNRNKGISYALLAALSNAMIGIFTNFEVSQNINPASIAFYRCLVAFLVLSFFLFINKERILDIKFSLGNFIKIAICSFFGIFILYFFETLSYVYSPVASVTFVLMGSSAILTFLLSKYFLNEVLGVKKISGLIVILIGMFFMILIENNYSANSVGILFAIFSGFGYSGFLFLIKKNSINSSLKNLWYFFGVGTIYLSVPFFINHPVLPNLIELPNILLLGIIPTLGGFYFTTRALQLIEASKTQIFELIEPVFASIFALVLLNQIVTFRQALGGALILIGIYITEKNFNLELKFLK